MQGSAIHLTNQTSWSPLFKFKKFTNRKIHTNTLKIGLVNSFRDVPYVDSRISWLAPTPDELPQHMLIHSAYLQAILGTSTSTHRIEQKGKLPYTVCHKTLSSSVFAPGSVGPGIQPHSRPRPSRDVFDVMSRHTNHPLGYAASAFKVYVATYPSFHPLTIANHRTTTSGLKRRDPKSTQKDFPIGTTFEPLPAGTAHYTLYSHSANSKTVKRTDIRLYTLQCLSVCLSHSISLKLVNMITEMCVCKFGGSEKDKFRKAFRKTILKKTNSSCLFLLCISSHRKTRTRLNEVE